MRLIARVGVAAIAAAAAWVALLAVAGVVAEGCVVERARARMARSLAADVTIGGADVSLLRGHIALRDVRIERAAGPHLSVTADAIDADMAGMGWMLLDRTIDALSARGVSLSISVAGAATLPRAAERAPIHARRMVLRDVRLEAVLTGYAPALGRVALVIDRAETGPIDVRDAMSWLHRARALDARVEAPGGVTGTAHYQDRRLRLGGGLLGAEPVELPLALPVPPPDQLESAQLGALAGQLAIELGKVMARRAIERRAADAARGWLEDKVGGGVKARLDGLLDRAPPDAPPAPAGATE